MTTPVLSDEQRRTMHSALQSHIKDVDGQLADIQAHHPDGRLRAGASLTRSLLASRAAKAKASFKAGGSPTIDDHAAVLASVQGFIGKANGSVPPMATPEAGQPTGA